MCEPRATPTPLLEIAARPEWLVTTRGRVHESCLRASGILDRVKQLLEIGTPGSVIRELIDVMESRPGAELNLEGWKSTDWASPYSTSWGRELTPPESPSPKGAR